MTYTTHTIYRGKTGRGFDWDTVGITFKPTPNLSKAELLALIAELQAIANDMK